MVRRLKCWIYSKILFFGTAELTKNANPNKYSYSGYGIGFDSRSIFSIPNFDWGKCVIFLKVDMRSSVDANNKNKKIFVLGKGQTKRLDNASLTAET